MKPGSPFYNAYKELYVDAALNNMTVLTALGDGGSGNLTPNGLTNLSYYCTSPYGILVGRELSLRPSTRRSMTRPSHPGWSSRQ